MQFWTKLVNYVIIILNMVWRLYGCPFVGMGTFHDQVLCSLVNFTFNLRSSLQVMCEYWGNTGWQIGSHQILEPIKMASTSLCKHVEIYK